MALLIASDLHKDIAGQPLLRGVSFKLERRERMTLAGRNGAGKTTLLRMLGGRDLDRPRRAERGQGRADRAARPAPAARARRGAARVPAVGLRGGAARSRRSCGAGGEDGGRGQRRGDARALLRAQARLEARGGYLWRDRASRDGARPRLPRRRPRPHPGHVLRRPADARVARARAGDRRRRAAAGRAHQPSGHRVARVARADARRPRRGGRAGRARPLVPGGGGHGRAGAVWRLAHPLALLRRHLAPVAARAGRARDGAGQGDRQAAGGDRAHGALHRALPLQGHEGPPGAVAGEEARARWSASSASPRMARASSSRSPSPSAPGG